MAYESIVQEKRGRVVLIRLNRPKQLNALNDALMDELGDALKAADADLSCSVIVIAGNERSFAAGADVAALKNLTFSEAYGKDVISRNWEHLRQVRKPVIAAVAGYALGGGLELAMMCDFICAADNAVFGQPEIRLGIIPGAGGTQRLPRLVGKSKAMDLILTARTLDAHEAEQAGIVSRVLPSDTFLEDAMGIAEQIAQFPLIALMAAKEAINRAYESPLSEGLLFERRLFHALFATNDQKEGMAAFLDKRTPRFKNR